MMYELFWSMQKTFVKRFVELLISFPHLKSANYCHNQEPSVAWNRHIHRRLHRENQYLWSDRQEVHCVQEGVA